MNETPMLFPIAPAEFWKQIRTTIEEVVNEKLNQQTASHSVSLLPERPLLKASIPIVFILLYNIECNG